MTTGKLWYNEDVDHHYFIYTSDHNVVDILASVTAVGGFGV